MSELPGGFQERDIKEGFEVLSRANEDDLDGLIEALPVLNSPVFHAELRRFRTELASADLGRFQIGLDNELEAHRAKFMANYDALFLRLHQRAYLEHIKAHRSQASTPTPPIGPLYAPPFFLALVQLLNGQLPLDEGPCYDPVSDFGALGAELSGLLGRTIELPAYEPTTGSLWCAILLICENCKRPRLGIRAYHINLVQAPDLLVPLGERRIDADYCSQCGAQVVLPKRVWIQERPKPRDTLASLSCLLFANPSELIYLAPPGTIRDAAYDRILEVRAEILMRQLSVSPPQENGNRATSGLSSLVIIYSIDELVTRLRATAAPGVPLPVGYLDFVAGMTRHLVSGIMPVYQVIEIIRAQIPTIAKDWPVVVADVAGPVEEPFTALVQNLIAEACAEVQGLPASTRAILTVLVTESLLTLHEVALAEASIARAENLLISAPMDEPGLDDARRALAQAREELMHAQGRHGQAQAMPQWSSMQEMPAGDSLHARLIQVMNFNNEALGARARGRFSEALTAFSSCVSSMQKLEEEARAVGTGADELLQVIRYHLSGAYANVGFTLVDMAGYLDLFGQLQQSKESSKLTPQARALLARAGSAEALMALQEEIVQRTVPILNNILPSGYTARTLLEIAAGFLQNALVTAEEVEGFDYASMQAHRLAYVLDDLNRSAEAIAMMHRSMKHSARVADYARLASGSSFLAQRAMIAGQGHEALAHWKEHVRYQIRELATRGGAADSAQHNLHLAADGALSCVAQGGDPAVAILIAESTKGVSTGLSLLRGVPLQSRADDRAKGDLGATRLSTWLEQRESLRLQVMWNEAEREPLRQQIATVERELEEARRDLGLQDPRYARWSDATHLEVSEARVITRILRELGPQTTLVGFLPMVDSVWVYALWADSQIIVKRPLPTELQTALDLERRPGSNSGEHPPENGTGKRQASISRFFGEEAEAGQNRMQERVFRQFGRILKSVLPLKRSISTFFVRSSKKSTSGKERQVGQRPDSQPYLKMHLNAVARVLLEPLAERLVKLTPRDRLILSPCEPLDLLPFGTLPFRGRPLCEQAALSIVQGSGMLEACENRPHIPVRTAVCIGAPTRSDVPDLSGALEEVHRVADLLKAANVQVQLLMEERATIAALQNLAAGSDLVHFACHAGNRTLDEHWAQLLLAPDPQVPDSGTLSEDQILSNLLLKKGCLVNLAGCRTGLLGNEGRYLRGGLVPAFLVAGAGSVIGSLWPLEDWSAATFQSAYYQRLIAGMQPAEALAITQRECIAGKYGSRLQDIRNWGSYLVYGIG